MEPIPFLAHLEEEEEEERKEEDVDVSSSLLCPPTSFPADFAATPLNDEQRQDSQPKNKSGTSKSKDVAYSSDQNVSIKYIGSQRIVTRK